MSARVYYNENDPKAAAWLRELIARGAVAPGDVDDRSIEDVRADDLRGYTQHHFFAGIGVWSYALRNAGWPDHRPVWTASCPCQPFSVSGKKSGFDDERHLWPLVEWLLREYREISDVPVIFGEQVASKHADPWFDLVQADVEALDYAFGCVPFPSAGIGAPHIRDRAYWVGVTCREGLEGQWGRYTSEERQREGTVRSTAEAGEPGGLADIYSERRGKTWCSKLPSGEAERPERDSSDSRPCPTNGFWRDADWLGCRDGKWRPVEPGTFPLDHGAACRVGRLRGYGNAINAEAARIFIQTVMEII